VRAALFRHMGFTISRKCGSGVFSVQLLLDQKCYPGTLQGNKCFCSSSKIQSRTEFLSLV